MVYSDDHGTSWQARTAHPLTSCHWYLLSSAGSAGVCCVLPTITACLCGPACVPADSVFDVYMCAQGGKELLLLPQYGGGWTECEVAELRNGSVLLTSRNFYGESSGYGPRLFARSDDGGQTWAANWSAGTQLPDPYCEGSMVGDAASGTLYFANPSNSRHRANFSIHASLDGGNTWPLSQVVYPGGGAYSDMAFTQNGSVAILFEKDNYNTVAFGVVPLPLQASRIRAPPTLPPATGTPPMATLYDS